MAKSPLSPRQVKALKTLARNPNGMTRPQLERAIGTTIGSDVIGPVYSEDLHLYPESLYARSLVYCMRDEDDENTRWLITSQGKKVANTTVTRDLTAAVVPPEILDPIVIEFRSTRTYSIELYTEQDMQEIRSKLGNAYAEVSINDLRQQIINRRKMGKYKTTEVIPEWYTVYRQGQHWTALVEEMTEHQGCIVNPAHKDNVSVYHRRYTRGGESVINREIDKDLIVLCASCRKKLNGNLPPIPSDMP